jgi:hypothetical protein
MIVYVISTKDLWEFSIQTEREHALGASQVHMPPPGGVQIALVVNLPTWLA